MDRILKIIQIIGLVIAIINLVITFKVMRQIKSYEKASFNYKGFVSDTTIRKTRIDSVHIVITNIDSIINRIAHEEYKTAEDALNANDSVSIELFYELIGKKRP